MKKARATKILCAVLTVMMVLGTGLSAMAAVTSTSIVKYNTDNTAYGVTTEVSGLAENEMVTYLVHNANNMYNVEATNIDYIDQKNATGTVANFGYKGTGDWTEKGNKIYVGAESITAPVESYSTVMEEGVAVTLNGKLIQGVEIIGKEAAGIKKIVVDCAAKVASVKYNGHDVEFFNIDGALGFYTDAAINEETDTIALTTGGASFTGDPTANGVLSAADIIAMGLTAQPVDPNPGVTSVSYANGQMASWNGILANVKGVSGGETAKDGFWYPNELTIGEIGGYETDVYVGFTTKPILTSNPWGGISAEQVEAMNAAYANGDAGFTFDITNWIPQGLAVKSNGDDIALEVTVPADGEYVLVARENAWEEGRTTNLTINGVTMKAVTTKGQKFAPAISAETVELKAGETYAAALDGAGSNLVRVDFIALVPVTSGATFLGLTENLQYPEGSTPLTEEQNAINDAIAEDVVNFLAGGSDTEGEVGIKIGTIKAEGNTFIALGRVKGAYTECGIEIYTDDVYTYPALGVAGGMASGGFAIELVAEEGADLAEEFSGAEINGYAYDANEEYITTEYFYMD